MCSYRVNVMWSHGVVWKTLRDRVLNKKSVDSPPYYYLVSFEAVTTKKKVRVSTDLPDMISQCG